MLVAQSALQIRSEGRLKKSVKGSESYALHMGARLEHGPFDGKVTRFFTSLVLRVDPGRHGQCESCGACCRFLFHCPFLKPREDAPGKYRCVAYAIRPPQCRKYPRTRTEQIHTPCGYKFDDGPGKR